MVREDWYRHLAIANRLIVEARGRVEGAIGHLSRCNVARSANDLGGQTASGPPPQQSTGQITRWTLAARITSHAAH